MDPHKLMPLIFKNVSNEQKVKHLSIDKLCNKFYEQPVNTASSMTGINKIIRRA